MKKKILILILSAITILTMGCSNNTLKDSTNDSIVIDENTKETINNNSEIKVELASKIEYPNSLTIMQKNPIHINYYMDMDMDEEGNLSQSTKYKLYTLNIGTISEKKDKENKFNIIDWEDDKDIKGQILSDGPVADEVRIYKEGKVYKFKENGELQEIKAYEKLVKEHGENLGVFMVQGDGSIDLWYSEGELNKCYIIDNEEDKFYEIDKNKIEELKDKPFSVITIEDNKIYIVLSNNENSDPLTIGYIENNKFYELISKNKGVNIVPSGYGINMNTIIVSNNKILFSGLEEDNGIWSYDIEKEEFEKEIDIEEEKTIELFLSKDKKKIIIRTFNTNRDDNNDDEDNYSISIGNVDENLEISNLTNVVSEKSTLSYRGFIRWSEDSSEFYLRHEDIENREKSFEVYRIRG